MLKPYKVAIHILIIFVTAIGIGEFLVGTPIAFVAPSMAAVFFAICTYNTLGGLSTFTGIIFADFAFRNIIFSQAAKIVFLEPAQSNTGSSGTYYLHLCRVLFLCSHRRPDRDEYPD